MAKLLLFSVVIMMLAGPVVASRDANERRGLRRVLTFIALYNIFYLFAVRYIYPRLL